MYANNTGNSGAFTGVVRPIHIPRVYDAPKLYSIERRRLSSASAAENDTKKENASDQESKSVGEFDYDAYEDYEPRTAGEKVTKNYFFQLTMSCHMMFALRKFQHLVLNCITPC